MKNSSFTQVPWVALFLLLAINAHLSPTFAQGPLTPPGAPTPTFKTLSQIEPRLPISSLPVTISVPGSYYVTTNLTQTNTADGIVLAADDITLDLCGFTLRGLNNSGNGIVTSGTRANLVIRNGTVRNWFNGINCTSSGGPFRFEQLQVLNNTTNGLVSGGEAIIDRCYIFSNGGHGIIAGNPPSIIRDCVVSRNTLDGIRIGATVTVVRNVVYGTGSGGGSTNALIRATGNRNRIEDNSLASHDNGVIVIAPLNFVFRNSAANVTTPFNIAAGNAVGPTFTSSGVVTNHPWANMVQ